MQKESFIKNGGKNFDVVPCLNDNDDHINLLEHLAEKFYQLSNGSFDITVQPLWNSYSNGKNINKEGIGLNNIDVSSKNIYLLNKYTEITLNSLTQGILTDRIHEILLNSGIKNHLINFGEGKASGMTPLNNKWNLYLNKKYIDITKKTHSDSNTIR